MAFLRMILNYPESAAGFLGFISPIEAGQPREVLRKFSDYLRSVSGGQRNSSLLMAQNSVKASGTITFASFIANNTVTINEVVFTAKASPVGANEFLLGGSDTATATNLAAKINASALAKIVNVVTATSAAAVVTVTCSIPGLVGNVCTLAISANGSVSGANLASGSEGTAITLDRS